MVLQMHRSLKNQSRRTDHTGTSAYQRSPSFFNRHCATKMSRLQQQIRFLLPFNRCSTCSANIYVEIYTVYRSSAGARLSGQTKPAACTPPNGNVIMEQRGFFSCHEGTWTVGAEPADEARGGVHAAGLRVRSAWRDVLLCPAVAGEQHKPKRLFFLKTLSV
ncbi:hypothetical protein AMECASPLE_034730 [Ameca splendens]|uniref:Uncharacterized protein n=1 Tax=Ameca splendens TaxID=208324 RepID=A0ABV1A3K2_9TELE